MNTDHVLNWRLVSLFLLGLLLLNYPLLSLFDAPSIIFGIPLLYGYIFLVWALLIVLAGLAARSRSRSV